MKTEWLFCDFIVVIGGMVGEGKLRKGIRLRELISCNHFGGIINVETERLVGIKRTSNWTIYC